MACRGRSRSWRALPPPAAVGGLPVGDKSGRQEFGLLQSAQLRHRRAGWALTSPFWKAQRIPLPWLLHEFPHSAPSWLIPQTPVSVADIGL